MEAAVRQLLTSTGQVGVHVWRGSSGPSRPVVVALHGLADSGAVYESLYVALNGEWDVVAVDAPGHGGTPWPQAPTYRLLDHVPHVTAVVDSLDELVGSHGPVVLLGHSMSALTTLTAAAARPEAVRHVVLEEPVRRPLLDLRERRWQRQWITQLQAMTLDERVATLDNGWGEADQINWAATKTDVDPAIFDVPMKWGGGVLGALRRAQVPVTVVLGRWGGKQSKITPWIAELYRYVLRGRGQVVRLTAGHSPRRDSAEAFAATTREVLESLTAQS